MNGDREGSEKVIYLLFVILSIPPILLFDGGQFRGL